MSKFSEWLDSLRQKQQPERQHQWEIAEEIDPDLDEMSSRYDPLGSYTGAPIPPPGLNDDGSSQPEQDPDDL
ncbi:MAG: hypothetical protein LBJ11_09245 [Oscillospiraceae bacterium]|jgi:hypothetical protein|nr:hypothetical protein [Oscillospiraceae bacterium]